MVILRATSILEGQNEDKEIYVTLLKKKNKKKSIDRKRRKKFQKGKGTPCTATQIIPTNPIDPEQKIQKNTWQLSCTGTPQSKTRTRLNRQRIFGAISVTRV
jgi:hypothetical protein